MYGKCTIYIYIILTFISGPVYSNIRFQQFADKSRSDVDAAEATQEVRHKVACINMILL
jgi:hypothetical protein